MPKRLPLLFIATISFPAIASLNAGIENNEIEVGGAMFHLRQLFGSKQNSTYGIRNYLNPSVVISHHGWLAGYFKNSHQKDSYVVGVRRYWPAKKMNNMELVPGFAVGVATGYCRGKNNDLYDKCTNNRKWQAVPYGQLFLKLKKDNVSLNLGYSLVVTYLNMSYYFN